MGGETKKKAEMKLQVIPARSRIICSRPEDLMTGVVQYMPYTIAVKATQARPRMVMMMIMMEYGWSPLRKDSSSGKQLLLPTRGSFPQDSPSQRVQLGAMGSLEKFCPRQGSQKPQQEDCTILR